jgi:hypothetical protein
MLSPENKLVLNLEGRDICGPSCLKNLVSSPGINQGSDGLTYCKQQEVLETSYDDAMSETNGSFQKGNDLFDPYTSIPARSL